MNFWEDPLSSLWFSFFFIIVPLILFIFAMRVARKVAQEEGGEDDKTTDRLKVY